MFGQTVVNSMSTVLGVIPARYGSQRFPGKLLAQLAGKTVLQRTYENACRCPLLGDLVIATDDARIREHAEGFGAKVAMTPVECTSGTERIAALLQAEREYDRYSYVVNIQGDEPCLDANALALLVETLCNDDGAVMATLVAPLNDELLWRSPSVVKCVRDRRGRALYFSRAPLPASKLGMWSPDAACWHHLGVYAYRRDFLFTYIALEDTPLQKAECLEQLKVLEHGFSIATAVVGEAAVGVDTPEDLYLLERLLCTASSSSSPAASALLSARG